MPAAAEQKQVSMAPLDLQALIAAAVSAAVKEAKAPYVDPKKVAQDAANRALLHQQEEDNRINQEAKVANCTHQREDGSWNLNGQYNCMHQMTIMCGNCGGTFVPGHPLYSDLIRRVNIPRLGNARN